MAQERLGLFDTPPDRREVRLGRTIVGLMFVMLLLILPLRNLQLPEIPAFIPVINAIMLVGELITATLLFAQAAVFRSRALTILATGFVAAALLLIPHALTFPGAFAPDGLLGGGLNTTAWIASFRRGCFPIFIILYVLMQGADSARHAGLDRQPPSIGSGVLAAFALAGMITLLTTLGHNYLPRYFVDRSHLIYAHALAYQSVLLLLFSVATTMLYRSRKSVLDMWLLVALAGWLTETLLVLALSSRFTAGWYGLFILTLFSHLVVMLALIAESNRLYARLALSTAGQRRERDARLMSMEAVTAAISHEVGQPLAAVGLNASAAVSWLDRAKPDVKKALTALRAVGDARQRTFDVIKSIRATFAKEPGRASEFSLNELVLDTVSLLDRELAASKVSLQLSLDQALTPILADRVQMHRVLVNLFINAIESLRATADRPRRLMIRSALIDDKDVLLEVSDTGSGIASEDMEHIFDFFFTTKTTGTGLGLPLCRNIVEDHGGRLWASQGEPHGANFHLRLPRSGAVAVALEATHEILTNLESSLSFLRQSKSEALMDEVAQLQHVIDGVRASLTPPKS